MHLDPVYIEGGNKITSLLEACVAKTNEEKIRPYLTFRPLKVGRDKFHKK